jgi:hypothetical protein
VARTHPFVCAGTRAPGMFVVCGGCDAARETPLRSSRASQRALGARRGSADDGYDGDARVLGARGLQRALELQPAPRHPHADFLHCSTPNHPRRRCATCPITSSLSDGLPELQRPAALVWRLLLVGAFPAERAATTGPVPAGQPVISVRQPVPQ